MNGKKNGFKTGLFSFALLLILAGGFCAALSTMNVPAMDAAGNGMITTMQASLADAPGSSGVFLDTTPFTSVETQQSAEIAARLAARKTGVDLRNKAVLYSVNADAEIIDGPSGGVAFSLLAYAEFSGKRLRTDFAATGSVAQDGSVGKVGGVAQKLEAVRNARLKFFLVPLGQSVAQGVDLQQLGGQWGLSVIEIASFDEAAAIAFAPTGSPVVAPKHEQKPLLLAALNPPKESLFMRSLAVSEIDSLSRLADGLDAKNDNSSRLVTKALRESLNLSRQLLEKNYYYSAANAAFVAQVAAQSFLLSNYSKNDFQAAVNALAVRVNDTRLDYGGAFYASNWEIVAGAQARLAWARDKAGKLAEKAPAAVKPLPFLEDYASAQAWIKASETLAAAAKNAASASNSGSGVESSVALNEAAARGVAEALAAEANASLSKAYDVDAEWHLAVARESISRGDYAAASFDSCFALGFSRARAKIEVIEKEEDLAALVGGESALAGFKSVWAQLYYVNSLYNAAEANRTGDFAYSYNALKLQELASCLEKSKAELEAAMLSQSPQSPQSSVAEQAASETAVGGFEIASAGVGAGGEQCFPRSFVVAALIALAVLFALIVFAVLLLHLRMREKYAVREKYGLNEKQKKAILPKKRK